MVHLVSISLGSNLGDKLNNLQQARDLLKTISHPKYHFLQASVYKTTPVDCAEDSPDFFNTVVSFYYHGEAKELIDFTQSIEMKLGRNLARERNIPREIDLDILLFGNEIYRDKNLTIPHPRMLERRFVLKPLSEILPDILLPTHQETVLEHLQNLTSSEPLLILISTTW
jgi:2-amino-4-hydroxy-6-hydroxymethyldihydropteridine diphosphokinase